MPASYTSRKGRYNGCEDLEGISGRGVGRLLAGDDIELDPSEGDLTESDVTISALPPDWDDITNKPTIPTVNKLTAGPAITLDPADGDLTKGNVKISATGNSNPGVAVIYEPIYIDLQSQYNEREWHNDGTTPDEKYWHFDYMGSEGVKDAAAPGKERYQFVVEETPVVNVEDIPAEANGFFYEVYWKTAHCTSDRMSQRHPCYNIDTPVETFMECKHITEIGGCEFVSGNEKTMTDTCTCSVTAKLSPSTAQYDMHADRGRQAKMNFATLVAGTQVTLQTKIMLMRYHYTAMWASLGRIKIIPVKMNDQALALKHIKPMLDNPEPYTESGQLNGTGAFYQFNEKDILRIQGSDIRQAVDELNSMIDFTIATGGDATTLNTFRQKLKTEVMQGAGGFEAVRAKLDDLKKEAATLGILSLTKFESDGGVVWEQPGNPAA